MSQLAKETWEALAFDEILQHYKIDPGESPVEVIAAKLEPVRVVLDKLSEEG